jgi:SP family sugar:H+ symporter-like MFS transporter
MAFKDWGISPMLMFSVGVLALSAFNYGFSDQAFSTGQAMDSFERQFVYDASEDEWALRPLFKSLFNSCKAGGQLIGLYPVVPY